MSGHAPRTGTSRMSDQRNLIEIGTERGFAGTRSSRSLVRFLAYHPCWRAVRRSGQVGICGRVGREADGATGKTRRVSPGFRCPPVACAVFRTRGCSGPAAGLAPMPFGFRSLAVRRAFSPGDSAHPDSRGGTAALPERRRRPTPVGPFPPARTRDRPRFHEVLIQLDGHVIPFAGGAHVTHPVQQFGQQEADVGRWPHGGQHGTVQLDGCGEVPFLFIRRPCRASLAVCPDRLPVGASGTVAHFAGLALTLVRPAGRLEVDPQLSAGFDEPFTLADRTGDPARSPRVEPEAVPRPGSTGRVRRASAQSSRETRRQRGVRRVVEPLRLPGNQNRAGGAPRAPGTISLRRCQLRMTETGIFSRSASMAGVYNWRFGSPPNNPSCCHSWVSREDPQLSILSRLPDRVVQQAVRGQGELVGADHDHVDVGGRVIHGNAAVLAHQTPRFALVGAAQLADKRNAFSVQIWGVAC